MGGVESSIFLKLRGAADFQLDIGWTLKSVLPVS
jgi:hypothetical protein